MMAAAWIILGKTKYPAEIIQTSREGGLKTVACPTGLAPWRICSGREESETGKELLARPSNSRMKSLVPP